VDVIATGGWDTLRMFKNNGGNSFTNITHEAGLDVLEGIVTAGVTTGDYDRDGDFDLFITTDRQWDNFLFRNNGDGTFTDVSEEAGITTEDLIWSTSAVFVDVNIDGYLDLYVVNYVDYNEIPFRAILTEEDRLPNYFFLNNRDGTFSEKSVELGLYTEKPSLAATAFDINGDYLPDLFEINDFHVFGINEVFLNQVADSGKFIPTAKKLQLNTEGNYMGVSVGDLNGDLRQDIYLSDFWRTALFIDEGSGDDCDIPKFTSYNTHEYSDTYETNVSWGTSMCDINNDTHLDIVVSCGEFWSAANEALWIFENDGHANFTRKDQDYGMGNEGRGRGLAVADFDLDGDIDLFWAHTSQNPVNRNRLLLYRNDVPNLGNWVKFSLRGIASNPHGFNATLMIYAKGKPYLRHVIGGSSYMSQHDPTTHFGLGEATQIDSLQIIWPGGKSQWEYALLAGERYVIEEEMVDFEMLQVNTNIACYTAPEEEPLALSVGSAIDLKVANGTIEVSTSEEIMGYQIWDLNGRILDSESVRNVTRFRISYQRDWKGLHIVGFKTKQGIITKKLMF
jgi:hypothetical protein